MKQSLYAPTMRFGMAGSIATTITFFLFFSMQYLIKNDEIQLVKTRTLSMPEFVRIFKPPVNIRDDDEQKPDDPVDPPPTPDLQPKDTGGPGPLALLPPPGLVPIGPSAKDILVPSLNSGLLIIVDMQPIYPQRAISKNIEGYVVVEFTVTESGSTDAIRIVEANPAYIFNNSAVKATSKSRFKPKIVDGKAVAVSGLRKKFTFEIED